MYVCMYIIIILFQVKKKKKKKKIRSFLYIHVILRSFSKQSRDRAISKLCTSKLLDTWKRWSQRIGKPLLFKLGG